MTSPLETAVDDIVAAANGLDAGLSLLLDHARKDRMDAGAHRADGPADESPVGVAGRRVAGGVA